MKEEYTTYRPQLWAFVDTEVPIAKGHSNESSRKLPKRNIIVRSATLLIRSNTRESMPIKLLF